MMSDDTNIFEVLYIFVFAVFVKFGIMEKIKWYLSKYCVFGLEFPIFHFGNSFFLNAINQTNPNKETL